MAMPPPPPLPPMSQSRLEEGLRPGGSPSDEPIPIFIVCMNVISTVTHILLGAVAFFAFVVANLFSILPEFKAHTYITTIGYTLLMTQAIFSLKPQSGWADNFKYPQKTKIFWLIQLFGSFLVIVGGIMGVVGIEQEPTLTILIPIPGLPDVTVRNVHFDSAHAIVGFIAMILATVSMVGAIAHLFSQNIENNSMLSGIQSCVLTVTIVLASVAICLAFNEYRIIEAFKTSFNTGMAFSILTIVGVLFMMGCNMTKGGRVLI